MAEPVPQTVREAVVAALAERLGSISTALGYHFDFAGHVYEWEVHAHDPNLEDFRLEYRDREESIGFFAVGEHECKLVVDIRIIATDATPLASVRQMIADVIMAIGYDVTLGGVVEDINQSGSWAVDKGQAADTAAGASVSYEIIYTTVPWDPYNG